MQGITIRRLTADETAAIDKPSLLSLIAARLPSYALLFGAAIIWLAAFNLRQGVQWQMVAAFFLGAILYWASLEILEPLQTAYFGAVLNPRSPPAGFTIVLLGSAAVFGVVEMLAVFLPVFLVTRIHRSVSPQRLAAVGAACGVAFGLMQAANLTQFTAHGAVASTALLLQGFALIGLLAVAGALIGLILASNLPLTLLVIPPAAKIIVNWLASFIQNRGLSTGAFAALSWLVLIGLLIWFFWLRARMGIAYKTARVGRRT